MNAGNSYGRNEKGTVDPDLQPWIEKIGDINVVSINYSQFMLVRLFLVLGQYFKYEIKKYVFSQM